MAPKIKLHQKNGKMKTIPSRVAPPPVVAPEPAGPSVQPDAATAAATATAERQFELELCWCIEQLEVSLLDKKSNPKQTQASMQILRVLKNNTQPMVKKRLLMRNHFGDYRAKMATEEKNAKKVNERISFTKLNPSSSKSTFLRKSMAMGDDSFRFNFDSTKNADTEEIIKNENDAVIQLKSDEVTSVVKDVADDAKTNPSKFHFTTGDFKFNFNVEEI